MCIPHDCHMYSAGAPVREEWMLPILLMFNGEPEVTEDGDLVYVFPELMATADGSAADGSAADGVPPPEVRALSGPALSDPALSGPALSGSSLQVLNLPYLATPS